MESITLGLIAEVVSFLVALLGGLAYLKSTLRKWLSGFIEEQMTPINAKLDDMNKQLEEVDMAACKNFLVRCISDFESGDQVNETEYERFWEQYQHYIENGGNSYIKEKVEKLKTAGKI